MKYVFILCQHRTGSTLLKNILDEHDDIKMCHDEMNLFDPFRKNTLDKLLGVDIKSSEDLIRNWKSNKIYGSFWNEYDSKIFPEQSIIKEIDKNSTISAKNVINVILNQLSKNMKYVGVKYPVHVSKAKELISWFPEAKFIILRRNPYAMISSKLNDSATKKRKQKGIFSNFFFHFFTIFLFCLEYRKVNKLFAVQNDSIHKLDYENLVFNKTDEVRKICNFLGIPFQLDMCLADGKQSSYDGVNRASPLGNNTEFFESHLSKFDKFIISILTKY